MTTKIHNGHRLTEGTNPFEFTRRVRAALDPVRDRADGELLARLFANAVDELWVAGKAVPPVLTFTAFSAWEDRQKRLDVLSLSSDPNGFEMCLGEDPATGRILVRVYTQRNDLAEAFNALDGVEPYSYWNNYDTPGHLTEADWAEREAAWGRVMPDYAPPAENMLTFVLRTDANPRTMMLCTLGGGAEDPVLTRLPDRAARARSVAGSAYALHLMSTGVEEADAFRRGRASRALGSVVDVLASRLPELTKDLLLEGSAGMCPDRALMSDIKEACAAVRQAEESAAEV